MSTFRRLVDGVAEEPLEFGTQQTVRAILYRPAGRPIDHAIVIAPPDGEERDWAQRPLVTAARMMAASGCAVLRFDYRGQGESDGDYEETTVRTRVDDLQLAWSTLAALTSDAPTVIGVRLGAVVALEAAAVRREIQHIVLWEPVLDPGQHLQQLLRVNVSTQMVTEGRVVRERQELIADARAGQLISVNGYRLSGAFIDELLSLDVVKNLDRIHGNVLALSHGALDPRAAAHARAKATRLPGAPFWKEPKLHTVAPTPFVPLTLDWIQSRAACLGEAS